MTTSSSIGEAEGAALRPGESNDLQDIFLTNAWLSQSINLPVPRPSTPAETTTSTVIVTISIPTETSSQPLAQFAVDQERTMLSKLRAGHDEETALARKEWRRKEKEIMKREMEVVTREEEVRRREVWVLEEVRCVSLDYCFPWMVGSER
jgi:hypothetical protein